VYFIMTMLACAAGAAPPSIARYGVVNAASQMPSGSRLARGSLLTIHGIRFGSAGTTRVVVETGKSRWPATVLSATGTRVEARLPWNLPLGAARLLVNVNNESAEQVPIEIVASAFGAFSRNGRGWGPAKAWNAPRAGKREVNGIHSTALRGQRVILAGTGLGSGARLQVNVGERRATGIDARRNGDADEIAFEIPSDAPEGCFVPVYVSVGAVPSNAVTIAIDSRGTCEGSGYLPTPTPGRAYGIAVRSMRASTVDGSAESQDLWAGFFRLPNVESAGAMLMLPPPGTCSTTVSRSGEPSQNAASSLAAMVLAGPASEWLDAGQQLNLHNGKRAIRILGGADLLYKRRLTSGTPEGPLFLSGSGGAMAGPFQSPVPGYQTLRSQNLRALDTLDRTRGLQIKWEPQPGANHPVLILIHASDREQQVRANCICVAQATARELTAPAALLHSMPATELGMPPATIALATLPAASTPITARGIDAGALISTVIYQVPLAVR